MSGFIMNAVETWASIYANHAAVRTMIGFLHIGGLLLGGGCAVAMDRMTLLAFRQPVDERGAQLQMLQGVHRIVVVGIGVVVLSGLLLFAADVDSFFHSVFFWIKMVLFGMLLLNGSLLLRAERRALQNIDRAWHALAATSVFSIVLWFLTTLAGAALPNIG
jgi:hypothetical protein